MRRFLGDGVKNVPIDQFRSFKWRNKVRN